jgi:multimeric flavodoxin WrbA
MPHLLAIYGSPRRRGNTAQLLNLSVEAAVQAGATVDRIVLRDLKMSPCLEIYGCKNVGRCVIQDDFQQVYDQLEKADGILLASPIFFYAVSAHTKILMDRCQSAWVKKYWIDKKSPGIQTLRRKGLFISVGATRGKRLFDGALLSVRYFMDALDIALWDSLLVRGCDEEGEILQQKDALQAASRLGRGLVVALQSEASATEHTTS